MKSQLQGEARVNSAPERQASQPGGASESYFVGSFDIAGAGSRVWEIES